MDQNIFALFTSDPAKHHVQHLKVQLFATVINMIRKSDWNQTEAAKVLNVSQPRLSNLMQGHTERFSIEALIVMLSRGGYRIGVDFEPSNEVQPLTVKFTTC